MDPFERAVQYLPEEAGRALLSVLPQERKRIQEIRLRRGGALTVSLPEGEMAVDATGRLSCRETASTVHCSAQMLERTFYRLCDYSVHTHTAELREGFVTARGGFRAGIAGTAVVENGEITAVRDISAVCLRIARRHDGSAEALLPLLQNGPCSMLILGEPSAGKTSILRDIGRILTDGSLGRRYRVTAVDERGELAGVGGLENADVLTGCPKAYGVLQAVRTLAPDVILLDELGTRAEVEAITENLHAGVPAVATAHARSVEEALSRPAVRLALARHAFDRTVLLKGRAAPGEIAAVMGVEELEAYRRDRHCFSGCTGRGNSGAAPAPTVDGAAAGDPLACRA